MTIKLSTARGNSLINKMSVETKLILFEWLHANNLMYV